MIKLVVSDFDGVFTDGKCFFDGKGNINKFYNVKDGMAIKLLRENNIEFGIISSYNTQKNILINNVNIDKEIIEHLNVKRVFVGKCENKMDILKKWMDELQISLEEVAYIGDDLNDLEILKKCKLSACPNDAVNSCRNHVNYVCHNKGGSGCFREFVELILDNKTGNCLIQEIKKEVNYQLENFNMKEIDHLIDMIKNLNGNIFFMGVGKSGNLAKHCCDLLKSISLNTFYLDTLNSIHGDFGALKENDIVFMFSKSGNTKELVELIPLLKNKKVFIIGICCDASSKFSKLCDYSVKLPHISENSGEINKIPTNSCLSQLLFSNIIVSKMKNGISIDNYKNNHPAGSIGNELKKIGEIMIDDFPKIILTEEDQDEAILIVDIISVMNQKKIGCCFFVNDKDELLGIMTDGDLRRHILKKNMKSLYILKSEINTNFYCETNPNELFINVNKNFSYVPIVNEDKKILGVVSKLFVN